MSIDFGKGPLDRLLEEDRRRRKMFEEIARPFGGASELARIGRDHAMTVRQFDSVIGGPTFRAMREITEQNRRFADQVRALVTPSYLDSLKETARALSSALPEMDARTNDLSRTLGPSFRAVSEALDIGASMRALVDTTRWMETLGAVSMAAASMQPTLDAFARSIESQWMREATTLRASRTATEIEIDAWALRQETNSANEALAKLAASDTPVDQLRWITSFFQAIARLFDHFQTNTVKEIQQAGLFFMLSAALMLAEVLDRIEDSDFGPSDRTELR